MPRMLATATRPGDRDRWFVFGGVGVALIGILVFARGLSTMDGVALHALDEGGLTALLMGLILLALGIGLATTTRYGRPGLFAAMGVPALVLGLSLLVLSLEPAETLTTAAAGATPTGGVDGGSSLLLAAGVVASLVGMTLLLVFGLRAKTTFR